ncbi:hypothetical protein ACFE04_024064 [Oxalis oulophora]
MECSAATSTLPGGGLLLLNLKKTNAYSLFYPSSAFPDRRRLFSPLSSLKVLKAQSAAKAKGYSDVLYLDCVNKQYLEEVSSCNIFVVKGNVISTPEIRGTILPGITRKSIIDVARSQGFQGGIWKEWRFWPRLTTTLFYADKPTDGFDRGQHGLDCGAQLSSI